MYVRRWRVHRIPRRRTKNKLLSIDDAEWSSSLCLSICLSVCLSHFLYPPGVQISANSRQAIWIQFWWIFLLRIQSLIELQLSLISGQEILSQEAIHWTLGSRKRVVKKQSLRSYVVTTFLYNQRCSFRKSRVPSCQLAASSGPGVSLYLLHEDTGHL